MWKSKKKRLNEAIQNEVIENEDYQRILKETAEKLDLPLDVVQKVIGNFLFQIPKFIYPLKTNVRVSVFGFFNITISKKLNNFKLNSHE